MGCHRTRKRRARTARERRVRPSDDDRRESGRQRQRGVDALAVQCVEVDSAARFGDARRGHEERVVAVLTALARADCKVGTPFEDAPDHPRARPLRSNLHEDANPVVPRPLNDRRKVEAAERVVGHRVRRSIGRRFVRRSPCTTVEGHASRRCRRQVVMLPVGLAHGLDDGQVDGGDGVERQGLAPERPHGRFDVGGRAPHHALARSVNDEQRCRPVQMGSHKGGRSGHDHYPPVGLRPPCRAEHGLLPRELRAKERRRERAGEHPVAVLPRA